MLCAVAQPEGLHFFAEAAFFQIALTLFGIGSALSNPVLSTAIIGALPPVLMDGGRRWWLAELVDALKKKGLV